MDPRIAVERLIAKGYRQNEIAETVNTSEPMITRIRKGRTKKINWALGDALIKFAKRARKRAGRAKE